MDEKYEINTTLTGQQLRLLNKLIFPSTGKFAGEEVFERKGLWRALVLPVETEHGVNFDEAAG